VQKNALRDQHKDAFAPDLYRASARRSHGSA
jgi:hypothetical protein